MLLIHRTSLLVGSWHVQNVTITIQWDRYYNFSSRNVPDDSLNYQHFFTACGIKPNLLDSLFDVKSTTEIIWCAYLVINNFCEVLLNHCTLLFLVNLHSIWCRNQDEYLVSCAVLWLMFPLMMFPRIHKRYNNRSNKQLTQFFFAIRGCMFLKDDTEETLMLSFWIDSPTVHWFILKCLHVVIFFAQSTIRGNSCSCWILLWLHFCFSGYIYNFFVKPIMEYFKMDI